MTFNWRYFLAFGIIFLIEVFIAVVIRDGIVRPFLGDVLVVIMLYCLTKTFFKISVNKAIIYVLIFAFTVEFAQYFKLVEVLGLEENKIARVVIGSTYDPLDLLAYLVGGLFVFFVERMIRSVA